MLFRSTQFVEIQDAENDLRLSDNFFHMDAGEKRITILEGEPTILKLRSVYHINN